VVILGFDIGAALTPDVPLFETFVRGVFMYLVVFVLIRFVLRGRTSPAMPDLLVLVLIADAAQNAMSNDYTSIPNGVVLVGSIVFTSWTLDWLGYHVPQVGKVIHRDAQELIVGGRVNRRTLDREMISERELDSQLRLQGVEDRKDVRASYLEGTGEVSVIKEESGSGGGRRRRSAATS
jgi:uncharacterized membrane protein YcaP (DUF421 family)